VRARRSGVAIAVLLVALAGCGAFVRKPPAKQRFVLTPGAPAAAGAALDPSGVLRVDPVRSAPLLVNRGFLYRVSDARVQSDFYNELAAPPGTLVRDALIDWLRASGRLGTVVRSSTAPPRWLLEADLERLEADARDPAAIAADLALEVRLLDAQAGAPRVLFEKTFAAREPVAGREPQALVDAWSRALARVLEELTGDLDTAMRRPVRR
jgi:ABC-type uncharacterized transport system auxiliary subunit